MVGRDATSSNVSTEKAEKISISVQPALVAVIDAHEANRSAYFVRLAEEDLRERGLLPGSAEADAMREARDLMQAVGAPVFRERLRTMASEASA